MNKKYVAPAMELFDMELAGVLAASNPKIEEGYNHMDAPGMVFMDDVDTEYKEDGDY